MYISTREMVISIIYNTCGILALIIFAINAHKSNANQRIQSVESVEQTKTHDLRTDTHECVKNERRKNVL